MQAAQKTSALPPPLGALFTAVQAAQKILGGGGHGRWAFTAVQAAQKINASTAIAAD